MLHRSPRPSPIPSPIPLDRFEVIDDATADMDRRMPPTQRLAAAFQALEFAAHLLEAGVRHTHPD